MKNKKVLFGIMGLIVLFSYFGKNPIWAEDIEDSITNNPEIIKQEETEEMKQQKKETLLMIQECLKEMRTKFVEMDNKVAKAKKQKEFENYPAIRLNIDTPVFGLVSMSNNKLKIRKDVSTVDIANGYSIKDIVNKSSIKLPDFTVGSIVVTTRDVDIDENMSYEDANITLLKMMQYMSQLNNANEFMDFQINRTFRGYIDKDKSDKLNDIKTRNSKVKSNLIDLDKKITYLSIVKYNEENITKIVKKYREISDKNYEIEVSVKDVLMSEGDIVKLQKSEIGLEGEIVELTKEIEEEYQLALMNIDEKKMLTSFKLELVTRKNEVESYVENASETQKIEGTENEVKNESEEQEKDIEKKNTATETVTKYEVTSKNTLEYMNTAIANVDEKIKKYISEKEEAKEDSEELPVENEEVANKGDVTKIEVKELSVDEKKEILEQLYRIYIEFLDRENKFYMDNTNYLLKDTTDKISDLTGKTNGNVLSSMKYMYLELPDQLELYINKNNRSSQLELKRLTTELKDELKNIVKVNINVNQLYKKMLQEEMMS